MNNIRYTVNSGNLPITVSLVGGITTPSNIHSVYEEGLFSDVVEGAYVLVFTDNEGCQATYNINLCPGCEMGNEYSGDLVLGLGFYRNLEMDNTLPLGEYAGRTKPIQTPIEFVERDTGYMILRNVPYVQELVDTPENWGMHDIDMYQYPDNNLRAITSVEYLGTYNGHPNCCKFYMPSPTSSSLGNKMGLFNVRPKNVWRNPNKIVTRGGEYWKKTYVDCGGSVWKDKQGAYCMIVTGHNLSGEPMRVKHHLFKATTLDGTWVDQNFPEEDIFASAIPNGYIGIINVIGNVKLQGDELYAASSVMWTEVTKNSPILEVGHEAELVVVMWNQDMSMKSVKPLLMDYTLNIGIAGFAWTSMTYYKGKFLYSFQDGTYNTGKRIVLQCDCVDGVYSYHSTILDFSNPVPNSNDGLMWTGSFANGSLFAMANALYFMSSGDGRLNKYAGDFYNHATFLWKYDDIGGTWSPVVSACPFLTSPHSTTFFGINWGWDHMGPMAGFYIENDKLWWTNSMNSGTDTYDLTNGYISIVDSYLATTTTTEEPTTTTTT